MPLDPTRVSLLGRLRDASDQAAWIEFEDRYRELMIRFCLTRGVQRNDADDVVQNVMMNMTKALPQFIYDPGRGRFRDYLFTCVRNSMHAWRRMKARMPAPAEMIELEPPVDEAEQQAWEQEWVSHHYRLAMAELSRTFDPQSVEAFTHCLTGATAAEVASELGMSEAAVHKIRQRVRERLRILIERQIEEEDRC